MVNPNPRDLALQALNNFDQKGLLPRYFLEQSFQKYPGLSGRDKSLCVHITNGVLRWRLRLDWYVEQCLDFPFNKLEARILNILRIALYQILFMDRIPESAAVNEAVKQAKAEGRTHLGRFVNGLLRGVIRKKEGLKPFPEGVGKVKRLSIEYSFPQWIVEKWIRELGEARTISLLKASNEIPKLVIRVNTLKTTRPALIERLVAKGISVSPARFSPIGICIEGLNAPVAELEAFNKGLFVVQGEAAQLCGLLLRPPEGACVLELCAGVGGKATHLAEQVGSQGRILGLDIKRGTLVRLRQTCERLGISWVYPLVADATRPLEKLLKKRFQRILIDSPCSALGVIARHPDIKWARKESHIEELSRLQGQILTRACEVLAPGGSLLYVTCTISREENEGLVESFLEEHPEMYVVDLAGSAPPLVREFVDEEGFFRTWPDVHGLDGFFAAMLAKK
ncbi:MAG: 16S rRNA (cytosine(967)-C(5))-methyltransferase RsmB [Deltaproteobacteria bacterium]|nr:MAG: 16S rRNA (cytosine(967)-C(5))-methyltransferase RsmB [Deltaproteobacteria bacterium]